MPAKIGKLKNLNFSDPAEKAEYNRAIFTQIAPVYGFLTIVLSFGRDSAWKKKLMGLLPEAKAPTCLDLACGPGDITLALARKYPRGVIVGLDLTPAMLGKAAPGLYPNVQFVQADMNHTGFEKDHFDIITGGYALRNAPGIPQALQEIRRILKPGGRAFFLDFSKSPSRLVSAINLFVLKFWGSLWGILLHGNPDIYAYIAESLRHFPDRTEFHGWLEQAGFRNISERMLFFGMLSIVSFEK
jgi:ubiquinone/menaquinone biosynthesis methyltransferase